MPDVELERARLRQPQQRRQVVAQQVLVLLVLVSGEHGDGLDEVGALLLPVLLEEALSADAVGHADHRQRPIGQVRQHERRDLREVAQQVALGQRRLLQRRVGRPVDAVEVGEADAVRADGEVEGVLLAVELRAADVVSRSSADPACGPVHVASLGARWLGGRVSRRSTPHATVFASMSSRRRRKIGARSEPSSVQLLEVHLGDELRLRPRSPAR